MDQRIGNIAKTGCGGRPRRNPLADLQWVQIGYEFWAAKVAAPERKTESIVAELMAKHRHSRASVWKVLRRLKIATPRIPWRVS